MKKKSADVHVEEVSGDKYPDLQAAQRLAMPAIVSSLDSVFRDLLERGILVVENGCMIPSAQARPTLISGLSHVKSTNNYIDSINA